MKKKKVDNVEINGIQSKELYLNESKTRKVLKDMDKQLDILQESLMSIHVSLNKLVNQNIIKGKYGENIKLIVKQSKIQSDAAKKLRTTIDRKFEEDVKVYPIQLLDKRITALEEKIASMVED